MDTEFLRALTVKQLIGLKEKDKRASAKIFSFAPRPQHHRKVGGQEGNQAKRRGFPLLSLRERLASFSRQ